MKYGFLTAIVLALLVSACVAPVAPAAPPAQPEAPAAEAVQPGEAVEVTVFRSPT